MSNSSSATPKRRTATYSRVRSASAVSERSPLLGRRIPGPGSDSDASSTYSAEFTVDTPATGHFSRRTRRFAIAACGISLFFGLVLFGVLLAVSLIPDDHQKHHLPKSFQYTNPSVDVLGVGDDGLHVKVNLMGGVNVDKALAIDGSRGDDWWENLRRATAHGVLGILPTQEVHVTVPEIIVYTVGSDVPLLNISLPASVVVPLVRDGQLRSITIEALGAPVATVGDIWSWFRDAWASGSADVIITMPAVHAAIPGAWWSGLAAVDQRQVSVPLEVEVPRLPNMPMPGTGHKLDLGELVKLHKYSFSNTNGLRIAASASIPNPGIGPLPFTLPFAIAIQGTKIAESIVRSPGVTSKEIQLELDGDLSPAPAPLEIFLRNFLHGKATPITARGMSRMPFNSSRRNGDPAPPPWVLHSLPSLSVDLAFPAPKERPKVVREVTIEGMKIFESGGKMHASGTVIAKVMLPEGMEDVRVNVSSIRPDVFVYDGPVEDDDTKDDDDNDRPDPKNPPAGAFGHIHPDDYLPASTSPDKDENGQFTVRAPFDDLALDVLSGRDSVLRGFIGKVIWKGGATAGVDGVADVLANIGLGELGVGGLPVRGEFYVKR